MSDAGLPPPEPTAANATSRTDRVAAAVRSWQRALVDLGGRNTLLWYRDLPVGTLDLTTVHPNGVSKLLAGQPTRLSELVREPVAFDDARKRARAIRKKIAELREERGVQAGFLAIGMATWTVPRAARPPAAPVLLRTVTLRPHGPLDADVTLHLGDEVELNPVLREYLRSEQGLDVDADAIEALATTNAGFTPSAAFDALQRACARVPNFEIAPRLVLGTFTYAKLPMVADLALQGDSLADHDVVAALAGDEAALAALRTRLPEPRHDQPAAREHLVLDADSSQAAAIDAARSGAHLVIQGPPGTGKSQTIANLIATLAAEGKSTLFVAEKRAAIDAVLNRLERVGLSDLVLDAYEGVTNRRATARQFGAAADAIESVPTPDTSAASDMEDARRRLIGHTEALHGTRDPWGVSAYAAEQAVTKLSAGTVPPRSRVRLQSNAVRSITRERAVELGRKLRDAAGLGAWAPGDDPWFGARILSGDEAAKALELTSALSHGDLERLALRLNEILAESHVPRAYSLADWQQAFATMAQVQGTLDVFRPEVFDTPLTEPIAATATKQWRAENGIDMGWLTRWRVKRQLRRMLRPGRPPADLHAALVAAHEQRSSWAALAGAGGRPEISARLEEGVGALEEVMADIDWLAPRLETTAGGGDLVTVSWEQARDRLADLTDSSDRLQVLPLVTTALDEVRTAGLGDLVDDLAHRGVGVDEVVPEVEHVWWSSVLQAIGLEDSRYGAHDGERVRRDRAEFVQADHEHLRTTASRVRAAVAQNAREVLANNPVQESLVRAEARKATRHKTIRSVMAEAGEVLTALRPCWAMSPLVVAQTLPPGRWFDVVIFDEASQVQPAQAVSAITRASQVVVAGDDRQLPPTNFFSVVSDTTDLPDTPEDSTLLEGFESVLDVLGAAAPVRSLDWHYRSRDERLIEFANTAMYGGAMTTFPGTSTDSVLRFEHVEGLAAVQADTESIETTDAEVERVVQLVIEHARQRPSESLGVIALGLTHARRIEQALDAELASLLPGEPALAAFFDEDRDEPFFIKNLERVQGDERDAVILSIGFGKTSRGRVLHRFGPVGQQGGERRLNVAMTRARIRMTVVSALRAADLDPEKLRTDGSRMLRDFLAHAERVGETAMAATEPGDARGRAASGHTGSPDGHVSELARRLRAAGLTVHEGYGRRESSIDIAVEDPFRDGRVLVAVELDGPRHAALPSVRDRDRLRPEHLERLGWRYVRVCGTDVFRDPAREVARIVTVARASEVSSHALDAAHPADAAGLTDAVAEAAPAPRKARRRAFRRGTAANAQEDSPEFGPTRDDTDAGWGAGDARQPESSHDRWMQEQRPPHWG